MGFSYEMLISHLRQNREIEFFYGNNKYSISNNVNGYYLTEYGKQDYQTFHTIDDLLANGMIANQPIHNVWKDVIIDVIF